MNFVKNYQIDKRITNIKPMALLKKPSLITFVNTFSYYRLVKSKLNIERFDYIGIDGQLQVILHNIFNSNKVQRYSFDFSSYAMDFFEYCSQENKSIALIGGNDEDIKNAAEYYKSSFKNLSILLISSGYITDEKRREFLRECIDKNIDYLVIGMGTPLQEETAIQAQDLGFTGIVFTCGGFIYQTGKKGDYYYPIIKKLNLRWLQRFIENNTVRKRLLIDYPKNVLMYFFSHIFMNIIHKS